MKGGIVTSIRVNPKDCQSVLDVIERAGIPHVGQSFSAMVALVLQSLLETARQNGAIPEPDEFQYLNRVGPYIKQKHSRKLEVSKTLSSMGAKLRAPAVPLAVSASPQGLAADPEVSPANPVSVDPEELRFASRRLSELLTKKDMADDGVDGVIWGTSDQEEYDKYFTIVYPEG